MYEIRHYLSFTGKDFFQEWRDSLRDMKSQIAVDRRINRMESGNFGDHKSCGDGVFELRIDFGPGFRIYYALAEAKIVLLLIGGDKSSQPKDIQRAKEYWSDWKEREDER